MPSIKHFVSKELYDSQCTQDMLFTNDLVTYSFDGDYVKILKSRFSRANEIITFAEYLELAQNTLKGKPYYIRSKGED